MDALASEERLNAVEREMNKLKQNLKSEIKDVKSVKNQLL